MDKRYRRYVPLDVYVAFEQPGAALKARWGIEGVGCWALFLAACKREPIQGTFTYTSEEEAWTKLGARASGFTLDEFFRLTGRFKNTRKTRSGHVTYVLCTGWKQWNDVFERQLKAEQKARKRADNTATTRRRYSDGTATEVEYEVEGEDEGESEEKTSSPFVPPKLTALRGEHRR